MATQGWNSPVASVHCLGGERSRPHDLSLTILACRVCDKICIGARNLIDHYVLAHDRQNHHRADFFPNQMDRSGPSPHRVAPSPIFHQSQNHHMTNRSLYGSHEDHFAHQRQNSQTNNLLPNQRERSNPFHHRIASSPIYHQRPHPYFPNGYEAFQQRARERNPVPNTNTNPNPNHSLFVPSQNPPNFQPRNHPAPSDSNLAVGINQFVVNRPTEIPSLQLGQPLGSNQEPAPFLRLEDNEGHYETEEKRTIWYLGQLEQPIPEIIDLESDDESHE